jgi:hypothetical protein
MTEPDAAVRNPSNLRRILSGTGYYPVIVNHVNKRSGVEYHYVFARCHASTHQKYLGAPKVIYAMSEEQLLLLVKEKFAEGSE